MKPWWKSKTILLNAFAGVASAGAAVTWPDVLDHAPKWLPTLIGMAWAGANCALRFVTTDEICWKHIREEDGNDDAR